MMGNSEYHIPVLLHDAVEMLITDASGVYVDVTFGGGGHSSEILNQVSSDAKLVAFDQDADALDNLLDDERFVFVPQNFAFVKNNLRLHRLIPVDGLLADLGVSSHQFDTADRGFSFRFDAELDMRMDKNLKLTAYDVINDFDEDKIAKIIYEYGEERNSRKIARQIVSARRTKKIETTGELKKLILEITSERYQVKTLSRVFQAIRIHVNNELEFLKQFLNNSLKVLKNGGRLVLISYHSLEDRIVKEFFKYEQLSCVCPKELPVCICEKSLG